MRGLTTLFTVILLLVATPAVAAPANIEPVTEFGSNPGELQMYRYVPDGLASGRPVVVALHGCDQKAPGYGTDAGWVQLADQLKFTLVLPEQLDANHHLECFNFLAPGDNTRGQGEAESIAQMVRRTLTDTGADPGRVYVTGLSAGGAMTAVLLATYPEMFAGGGIVAGVVYRCPTNIFNPFVCTATQLGDAVRAASPHPGPWPTVSIWQGTDDGTVPPAHATKLVEQWTNVHGIPATPTSTDTVAGYPHAVYAAGGRTLVESYTLTGMGHGQPIDPGTTPGQCGQAGAYMLDVNICTAWHLSTTWQLAD